MGLAEDEVNQVNTNAKWLHVEIEAEDARLKKELRNEPHNFMACGGGGSPERTPPVFTLQTSGIKTERMFRSLSLKLSGMIWSAVKF